MRSGLAISRAELRDAGVHRTDELPALNRWAFRVGLSLVVLGVACRLYVYLLHFPIWRDEAALALNLVNRDFRGLLHELDNYQVAPLFFLWIEKTVYTFLGGSPAMLRLVPLLAGIMGLVLFWRLARQCLTPLPAALAVGFLAVASSPIHLASMIKPYSLDLFLATLLLTLAASYVRDPSRNGHLAALALVIPLAVPASYPAVFVAGGISLVLLPIVWRQGSLAGRCRFAAFNVLLLATFVAHLQLVGREVHDPSTPAVGPYMAWFWQGAFPPRQPLAALHWLLRCHVGHMFSYPLEWNGGGLVGLVLVMAGSCTLYRRRHFGLLGLCLAPLALNCVAAALRRYPYAGDQRVEQHLAPGLCLLLGLGAAELMQRCAAGFAGQKRWATAVAALLVSIGLAGSVCATLRPYYDVEAAWADDIGRFLRREVRPHDRIVFPHIDIFTLNCLRWQLLPIAGQVCRSEDIDWRRLEQSGGRLWFVDQMIAQMPAAEEPQPRDPRQRSPELAREIWHIMRSKRFLAREPKPCAQLVYHYCCDLYVLESASWALHCR